MSISCILPILAFSLSQRVPVVVPDAVDGSPPFAARALLRTTASDPIRLKYLVVPVRFASRDSTYSVETISKAFDGAGQPVSVRQFYQEQSRGKVETSFQYEPWMLSGVVRDSLGEGVSEKAKHYTEVVGEIDARCRSRGISLSDFDNDGDGFVDGLIIVVAGGEYQETHELSDPSTQILSFSVPVSLASGTKLRQIFHVAEIAHGMPIGPGGVAHELAHMLGASDLYDEDGGMQGLTGGVGSWDLMSEGNTGKWWVPLASDSLAFRKPAGFTAFSRMQLGWIQPKEIESTQEVRLKPGEAARLWTDSLRTSEYLLMENRDRSGVDSILPGPGLMVLRVRTDKLLRHHSGFYNNVNSDSSRMGVQVIEGSGKQDMCIGDWRIPSLQDLFTGTVDSLTDDGPVPLKLPDGTRTGAWIRGIHMDGDDIVFQANPAKRLGYGWESGSTPLVPRSVGGDRISIVMPIPVSPAGRIVAMTSSIPRIAGKTCVGIWEAVRADSLGAPIVSACDSGGFTGQSYALRRFHHDLQTPISVQPGRPLWIGQTIDPIGGVTYFTGMDVDPAVDTTWAFEPGKQASTIRVRPLVGILVQTDSSPTSSVPSMATSRDVGIRRVGDRLRLDGVLPGESIRLALRDPRGRLLWSGDVSSDAAGSAVLRMPIDGSGLLIVEARGSFGTRTSLLPRP